MPRNRRILIIDQHYPYHTAWEREFGRRIDLTIVPDFDDGFYALEHTIGGFSAVAIDVFQEGETLQALTHLPRIRDLHPPHKPIVGIVHEDPKLKSPRRSKRARRRNPRLDIEPLRQRLIEAGCAQTASHKTLPDIIFDLIHST